MGMDKKQAGSADGWLFILFIPRHGCCEQCISCLAVLLAPQDHEEPLPPAEGPADGTAWLLLAWEVAAPCNGVV